MVKLLVGGWLRHTFTTLGGAGMAAGYFTQDDVTAGIGALMTLFGIAWSAYQKYKSKK